MLQSMFSVISLLFFSFFFFHLILQMFVKSQRLYFNIFLCIKSLGNAMLLLCFWNHLCAHNPVLSHFSRVQLFATLWTVAHQAPLSTGFSRQECYSGLSCSPPGDLPDPGIKPTSLISPALAGGFFTTSTTWEVHCDN